ncbi:MAG: helix-turn-helix transcriptional regulator [Ruminococcus sp.]|nr:helix-turn-helix transcriptional regulator [Ruminococcus sp.]
MNIKKFRLKKKLSQKKLVEKLNVSQQTVAKWENQKGFPRSEVLPKLAAILNCRIEDLYK